MKTQYLWRVLKSELPLIEAMELMGSSKKQQDLVKKEILKLGKKNLNINEHPDYATLLTDLNFQAYQKLLKLGEISTIRMWNLTANAYDNGRAHHGDQGVQGGVRYKFNRSRWEKV